MWICVWRGGEEGEGVKEMTGSQEDGQDRWLSHQAAESVMQSQAKHPGLIGFGQGLVSITITGSFYTIGLFRPTRCSSY